MFEEDSIDTQRVVMVGVFGAVVAFILIMVVQVLYYRMEKADEASKFLAVKPAERLNVQNEQLQKIHEYRWADRTQGRVAIPIEAAMAQFVQSGEAGSAVGAPVSPGVPGQAAHGGVSPTLGVVHGGRKPAGASPKGGIVGATPAANVDAAPPAARRGSHRAPPHRP